MTTDPWTAGPMTIDHHTMRALADWDNDLAPSAGPPSWERLEATYSLKLGADFKAVSSVFDGFLVHDERSWFMLWGVDRIIENSTAYRGPPMEDEMVPLGDDLLESDVIVARISQENAHVRLLYEGRDLAPASKTLSSCLLLEPST